VPYQVPSLEQGENRALVNQVTKSFPARGEFVSAEWEMGHPCAKIRNSIEEGTMSFSGQQLSKAGRPFDDDRVALDETIYFALDTKRIVKLVRSYTIDRKMQAPSTGGGTGPSMSNGAPSGRGERPGMSGGPQGGPPGASDGGDDRQVLDRQRRGSSPGGGGPGLGTPQGGAQGGRGGAGASGARTQYIRLHYEQIFLLEQ
jgi:hypothetical protein